MRDTLTQVVIFSFIVIIGIVIVSNFSNSDLMECLDQVYVTEGHVLQFITHLKYSMYECIKYGKYMHSQKMKLFQFCLL